MRYVVMTIAEARASGKRAAGHYSRGDAEYSARRLNGSRSPHRGRFVSWALGEYDSFAVVDTELPVTCGRTTETP